MKAWEIFPENRPVTPFRERDKIFFDKLRRSVKNRNFAFVVLKKIPRRVESITSKNSRPKSYC